MDVLDCIDKSAFLGREWLVWIWFKSELYQGPFALDGFGPVEVWIENQLTLEAMVQELEQSVLKGPAPGASPEAHEALRQGKLPTSARMVLKRDDLSFGFSFKSDTLALGAVKLPALVKEQTDERFYERMHLLEDLEAMLDALWDEFLLLRMSKDWDAQIVPAIRRWVHERDSAAVADYEGWLASARQPAAPAAARSEAATVSAPAE